ncbi:hypothetical protein V3W47_18130 [Deinococcus sp. YIM 134068]|uniref:hypothetical protein n=1 Tax=Deinococcus lichenicola TaxID=3118910 RepID=UPI002F95B6EB
MTRSSHVTVQISPGLKRMRLPNRSLQVCLVERSSFGRYATEFARAGLYVLIDDPFEISRVYVGETEKLSTRLTQHFRDPDKADFHAAITVHDDGTLLDKLGAKYLEHRVVATLSQHGLASNVVRPTAPRVADHIADALEELFSDLQFVCFSVNLNLFERQRVRRDQTRKAVGKIGGIKQRGRVAGTNRKSKNSWDALMAWLELRTEQSESASVIADFIAQGGPAGGAPKELHIAAHRVLKTASGAGFKFKS